MLPKPETSKHNSIKAEIFAACNDLGFNANQEYKGRGWRADVFAVKNSKKVAFEIQISSQSLKKTLERQEKYIRDGVIGCWLFEKPLPKLSDERPDLPLFYVMEQTDKSFSVSLSGRKELPLHNFLEQFLDGNIKFCEVARATPEQSVKLVFYEMECWKCKAMNHIYYVETNFHSACNAVIHSYETLWGSDRNAHRPEIIALAKEYIETEQGKNLKLGEIKRRFSNTVQDSYMSFGCYNCDSIFGDWYVMEAQMEAAYGYGQVAKIERKIKLGENIELPIPHWCYPSESPFCDAS
jgi:hypothetical protein